jgi:hypothetical protein
MILVFKTTVFSEIEIHIRAFLDSFSTIKTIDFDFEDCDNILRIEASQNITSEIQFLLNSKGFLCEELI